MCETAPCVWGMGRAKVSDKAGKVKAYDLGLQSVGKGESWKNMEQ